MNTEEKYRTRPQGKTKQLALIGLMSSIICIAGPLTIPLPFSPVPISLANLAIFLTIFVLGCLRGTVSYLIYLLLGMAGLPVFSAFTGGAGKLFGPTGGYLIGFIFMILISGFFIDRWSANRLLCITGMILGAAVCNLFGTFWLSLQAGMNFSTALASGVLPFIPGDLLKICIAAFLGPRIRKQLKKAGLS